jgi:hypothetical protein
MDEALVTTPFDACEEYRSPHHEAACDACGWLEADHFEIALAEVIPVPVWAAQVLQRAS